MQPCLGLGFLAGVLSPGNDVLLLDCILEGLGPRALARRLADFRPDVAGFQVNTFTLDRTARYLDEVRRVLPRTVTVAGGPHPSVRPAGTLDRCGDRLDAAFIGEAEPSLPGFVDACRDGRPGAAILAGLPGVAWRQEGRVERTPSATPDLASLPLPRWDLMDPRRYPMAPHSAFFRQWPVAPIIASRGCPYACTFCAGSTIHGRRLRYRPLDLVMEEVRLLTDRFGVREIQFVDDNLTFDPAYVHALCDRMAALPRPVLWSCPNGVRLDSLEPELLRHMKASGCYAVGIGIESGSPEVLARVRKGLDPERIREGVARVKEAGIESRGFFVLGFPGETAADMARTVRLALELPLDFAHFMFFHPIPGTEAGDAVLSAQAGPSWPDQAAPTFAEVAWVPEGMTANGLRRIRRDALMRFYLRPSRLAGLARQVRGPRHLGRLLRRIARWLP